jgi:hypothetical protein
MNCNFAAGRTFVAVQLLTLTGTKQSLGPATAGCAQMTGVRGTAAVGLSRGGPDVQGHAGDCLSFARTRSTDPKRPVRSSECRSQN